MTQPSPIAGTAGSAPHVEFAGVRKSYDGKTMVVKDLDLSIRRGEFVTLLGPSGSGKTTSLMMLAGFERPTEGDIYLSGRSIGGLPPHRRNFGVVFQNYALFPHMTVAENLAFPLSVRRVAKAEIEERVRRALDMVSLAPFGSRRPAELSGGQQQRVALARALVFDPELVLMDEPLGALDKQLRERMQLEIKHIHESLGVTVVYVTHDQTEALTMSDRIAVFDRGEIQQVDRPSTLYEEPRNSFVANFIGDNNRLRGTVRRVENGWARVELAGVGEVTAVAVAPAGPGDPTTLSVRPERVRFGPGENTVPCRVLERIYLGDHLRLRLDVAGSDDFMVKIPLAAADTVPADGAQAVVSWAGRDCRALDPI